MVMINMPSNGFQPRPKHFFKGEKDENNDGMPDNFVRKFNFKAEPTAAPYYLDKVKKGKVLPLSMLVKIGGATTIVTTRTVIT